MFLFVVILLLLAAVFGVLGAVLKAVAFLVVTGVLTVTLLGMLAWWGVKRKARAIHAEFDRQIAQQRVTLYRTNEASTSRRPGPERLPPRDDRY